MPTRGFSLSAGVLTVTALTVLLLVPLPLHRLGTRLAHANYTAFAQGLDTVSDRCTVGSLARAAQRIVARRARHAATISAFGGRTVRDAHASAWSPIVAGIEFRTVTFTAGTGEAMRLLQVRVNPTVASLRLHSTGAAADVPALARRANAIAAINASYFDANRQPLGYLKINGRVRNGSIATGAAFTGVFTMTGNVPQIVSRERFNPTAVDTALQAGPRLVAHGAPTKGLRETRSFRQTGVAVTNDGHIVMYATDGSYRGATWAEMQSLLTGPSRAGGIDPSDVLNLDGGSSSQIYVRQGAQTITTGFPTLLPVIIAAHAR
ncbi:MAG: phosphodiester glycosidase family protein [Proteobacteria bacterium]|nr:phosphodiester glycosidase family protein [Pseudomonadota bacterium]